MVITSGSMECVACGTWFPWSIVDETIEAVCPSCHCDNTCQLVEEEQTSGLSDPIAMASLTGPGSEGLL